MSASGEEIYFVAAVGALAAESAAGVDMKDAAMRVGGGFDLDAQQARAGIEDEVVGGVGGERAGEAVSAGERGLHEADFGPFALVGHGRVVSRQSSGKAKDPHLRKARRYGAPRLFFTAETWRRGESESGLRSQENKCIVPRLAFSRVASSRSLGMTIFR